MTTRIVGGSSQSGGASFSGAAVDNQNPGITLRNNLQSGIIFTRTLYDTDSYFGSGAPFKIPKQGYYAFHLSFVADTPFIGHWEFVVTGMNGPAIVSSGNSVSGENPEDYLYAEAHFTALSVVTASLTQTSGADQLIYPTMRIHYLGS